MIKKILIIALKYSYGRREFGPSINKGALIDSFNNLGFTTKTIWIDEHSKYILNKLILNEADNFNPDLIFFKLFKDEINSKTLLKLKNYYKTVNWFGDDQWRFDSFTRYYANKFTFCITTDKFSIEKYKKIGNHKVILSQHASIQPIEKYKKIDYIYDVSFVGTKSPFRDWFLTELNKRGIKCVCFGKGWNNGLISYQEMQNIFETSKINLNISNSLSFDLRVNLYKPRNLLEIFKSKFLGNRKITSQIKARNFEIPVFGGFQLTNYVPGIEDYLQIGTEVACYNNVEDAFSQIIYFLNNNDKRESIRTNSVIKARNEHTYLCRMRDIIENIYLYS
tara:strand:+ start:195 stop:1202 length:1008 start_codon:yes stop_codon:yes gene_type:complete